MIQIKKFKLITEKEVKIEYIEILRDEDDKKVEIEIIKHMRFEVHDDLILALNNLKSHLMALCEFYDYDVIQENYSLADKFEMKSITYGGSDEYKGVVLCGHKKLKGNRVLNLVSPFCMYNNENSFYENDYELAEKAQILEGEIIAYINGKHAPSKQIELDFSTPTIQEYAG